MKMEIHIEKVKLIQWLAGLTDVATFQQLVDIKQAKETDWWEEIDQNEKYEIEKGLDQAEKGVVVTHKEFMQKYANWL